MYRHWDWLTLLLYLAIGFVTMLFIAIPEKSARIDLIDCYEKKTYSVLGKSMHVFLFLFLMFIACFRYVDVNIGGTDALGYINEFYNAKLVGFNVSKVIGLKQQEPLFYALTYLVRTFTDDYLIYFFVIYGIMIFCYIKFLTYNFNKNMSMIPVFLFILTYIYSFAAFRSSLAVAIGFCSLDAFRRNKKISAVVLAVVAFLFHYTAAVVLMVFVFYEIYGKERVKKGKLIVGIIAIWIIIFLGMNQLQTFLLGTKYCLYLENRNSFLGQLPIIIFIVLTLINHNALQERMGDKRFYLYCVYFNGILIPMVIYLGAYRLNDYFAFPRLVVMSYLILIIREKLVGKDSKGKVLVDMVAFFIIVAWSIFKITRMWYPSSLMPYVNIIFK